MHYLSRLSHFMQGTGVSRDFVAVGIRSSEEGLEPIPVRYQGMNTYTYIHNIYACVYNICVYIVYITCLEVHKATISMLYCIILWFTNFLLCILLICFELKMKVNVAKLNSVFSLKEKLKVMTKRKQCREIPGNTHCALGKF